MRHLGYVGQNLSLGLSTSRGTILRNATPERLRSLIRENLANLARILEFNAQHQIYLFRISSRVIPFGSHPVNPLAWWEEFAPELARLGDYIRRHGMRVSTHPGQYTLLNSPDPEIVATSFRDFQWQARFLDSMGLSPEHKMVTHGGGVYGDKSVAIERFIANYRLLPPNVRIRLVLENDERLYTVEDLLGISKRIGIPVVFDWLHHQANPSGPRDLRTLLKRCFATWRKRDGIPAIHFSSQAPGQRLGAHAEYVDPEEFLRFYREVGDMDFDCVLEAKAKDLALLRLREQLNRLPLAA
ncbi:MAG: UV DNA damage repair endonuclease UvsE [Chloroflexota bacterium]|jgi:UV DNA damage endonuclease